MDINKRRLAVRLGLLQAMILVVVVLLTMSLTLIYEGRRTSGEKVEKCEEGIKKDEKVDSVDIVDKYKKPDGLRMSEEDWRYFIERGSELGVDIGLAEDIIMCESGGVATAKNVSSSAHGYFQIIDSTVLSTVRGDPQLNLEVGLRLLKDAGSRPWNSSRGCWGY